MNKQIAIDVLSDLELIKVSLMVQLYMGYEWNSSAHIRQVLQ